jgi:hypothetical protein
MTANYLENCHVKILALEPQSYPNLVKKCLNPKPYKKSLTIHWLQGSLGNNCGCRCNKFKYPVHYLAPCSSSSQREANTCRLRVTSSTMRVLARNLLRHTSDSTCNASFSSQSLPKEGNNFNKLKCATSSTSPHNEGAG